MFFAMAIGAVSPSTNTWAALDVQAPNDFGVKPLDRSCYVREEDGLVRYYLEGRHATGNCPIFRASR
jgi:hypothetical protein